MNNTPIKILYVIDSYVNPNAGTEGQLFQLIKHLDRKLFEPRLLVLMPSEWIANNEFPCPVEFLGKSAIKSPLTWLALFRKAKQYKNEGIGLAHVYFNDSSVICPPVFKFVGIKTFISRRDMGYWYNALYRIILPITGCFVTRALVNSKAVGEVTHKVEKIPENRVSVIYNGYELDNGPQPIIQELVDYKGQSTLLGVVANIRSIKRMQDAIKALANIQYYDVKLVVIGSGDASKLILLSKELGVEDKLLFLGGRDDVKACLQYIDIGLLCSESEGFSNAIVEYQFAGLPVICTEVGGNPEAVTDNQNGYLYEAGNVKELQDKLIYLLENKDIREKMAVNAKITAINNYSIEKMISTYQTLYQDSLGTHL